MIITTSVLIATLWNYDMYICVMSHCVSAARKKPLHDKWDYAVLCYVLSVKCLVFSYSFYLPATNQLTKLVGTSQLTFIPLLMLVICPSHYHFCRLITSVVSLNLVWLRSRLTFSSYHKPLIFVKFYIYFQAVLLIISYPYDI